MMPASPNAQSRRNSSMAMFLYRKRRGARRSDSN